MSWKQIVYTIQLIFKIRKTLNCIKCLLTSVEIIVYLLPFNLVGGADGASPPTSHSPNSDPHSGWVPPSASFRECGLLTAYSCSFAENCPFLRESQRWERPIVTLGCNGCKVSVHWPPGGTDSRVPFVLQSPCESGHSWTPRDALAHVICAPAPAPSALSQEPPW